MIDLNKQILILLYSFFSGIFFGVGFDTYRILINNKKNIIIDFIKYTSYWIFLGIGVFYFLLHTQYAILSFYTYFYILLGVVIYFKFISKHIFYKIKKKLDQILIFFRLLIRNILYVLSLLFKKNIDKNL